MIDAESDIHAIDRANAWSALRDCDFEKAGELFDNIIYKEPQNHEAYWGRALARASIIYVTDLDERKRVPTCNNISENSFLEIPDVKKAISLAPPEIAESYKTQSAQIESIRVEWIEKARKEPPYDVFISFKDSDRERGITRTQDSIDAQDLYNMLQNAGMKVFFSRISLLDKVSEKYEPYIYNAIKTAKVMIVFGERPEYFSAVWIKNEWSRFIKRIESGEKHQNSLVIVYKDMNPAELPTSLSSRQCVNYADMPAVVEMLEHVKRVVAAAKKPETVGRIDITGGEMTTRSSTIQNNTIETKELGQGATAETNISEDNQFKLVERFIGVRSWDDAREQLNEILLDHPQNAQALWLALMIKHQAIDKKALISNAGNFDARDLATIKTILDNASKDFAIDLLDRLYCLRGTINEDKQIEILKLILPYKCPTRSHHIRGCFETAIQLKYFKLFNLLISTLKSDEVDNYIQYYTSFARETNNFGEKLECVEKILSVNPGNSDALRIKFEMDWESATATTIEDSFKELLRYSKNIDKEVELALSKPIIRSEQCDFLKEAIRYYKGDYTNLNDTLLNVVDRMIHAGHFNHAQYFVEQAIALGCNDPKVYWQLCLIKIGAKDDTKEAILASDIPLKSIPEYKKYLSLVDEWHFNKCVNLATEQELAIKERIEERKRRQEESIRLENERIARENKRKQDIYNAISEFVKRKPTDNNLQLGSEKAPQKKASCLGVVFTVVPILFIIISTIVFGFTFFPGVTIAIILGICLLIFAKKFLLTRIRYKTATKLIAQGKASEAFAILIFLRGYKDSVQIASSIFDDVIIQTYHHRITVINVRDVLKDYVHSKEDSVSKRKKKTKALKILLIIFLIILYMVFVALPYFSYLSGDYAPYITLYSVEEFEMPKLSALSYSNGIQWSGTCTDCDSLTNVIIPNYINKISYNAFSGCDNINSVIIPNSVTYIGNNAFNGCDNLTTIVISKSVTEIERNAFANCPNLKNIYYTGSMAEWNEIDWNYDYPFSNHTITYNYSSINIKH